MWRNPELWPFFCLVSKVPFKKQMVTRVMESIITALVAALGGGFIAISVATAKLEEKLSAVELRVDRHLSEALMNRQDLFRKLDAIQDCLMKRCNK